MARPPNIERPERITIVLPESIRAKLDLFLWSTSQSRVPYGAYSKFFLERVNEFFTKLEPK